MVRQGQRATASPPASTPACSAARAIEGEESVAELMQARRRGDPGHDRRLPARLHLARRPTDRLGRRRARLRDRRGLPAGPGLRPARGRGRREVLHEGARARPGARPRGNKTARRRLLGLRGRWRSAPPRGTSRPTRPASWASPPPSYARDGAGRDHLGPGRGRPRQQRRRRPGDQGPAAAGRGPGPRGPAAGGAGGAGPPVPRTCRRAPESTGSRGVGKGAP